MWRSSGFLLAGALLTGCFPPDGKYDLVGNDEDVCGTGSVAEVFDDFNDNEKGPNWAAYADRTASVQEVNGQVEMGVDGSANAFAGYAWIDGTRSLVGCRVSVHMKQVASTTGDALTYFTLKDEVSGLGEIRMGHVGQSLEMAIQLAEGNTMKAVPYDPVLHGWWRIREVSGTVSFETSEDGEEWLPLFDAKTPSFASNVGVNVGMGVVFPPTEGGFAVVDNLNVAP